MGLHGHKYKPVKIPVGVMNFFAPRDYYVKRVDYCKMIQNTDMDDARWTAQSKMPLVSEWKYTNNDEKSERSANYHARLAAKFFHGQAIYDNIRKSIMFNTGTEPIRVRFDREGVKTRKVVYVKRPNANRIVGKYAYNMISGYQPFRFGFNETAFIEEGVSGSPLSSPRIDERRYLRRKDYKRGLVKAAVHAAFLDLVGDVIQPDNRLIDTDMNTLLFDFDIASREEADEEDIEQNVLLQPYLEMKGFLTDELIDIFNQERNAVAERVATRKQDFFRVMRITGSLKTPGGMAYTIDEVVRNNSTDESLEARFKRKLERYAA